MVSMETRVEELDEELHVRESACRAWCLQEGLEFTPSSRLAHSMLFDRPMSDVDTPAPDNAILPRPWEDEAAWTAMSRWRHPHLNLNLLQLSFVLRKSFWRVYLWHPAFLEEEDYRDDSGKLVNHPLHLDYIVSWILDIRLDNFRDELFREEGLIDLTPSRIMNRAAAASLDTCPIFDRVKTETPFLLQEFLKRCEPVRLAPPFIHGRNRYDLNLALGIARKLSGPQARPSTVELVWMLATAATSNPEVMPLLWLYELLNMPTAHKQETLILVCQSTWNAEETKSRRLHFRSLARYFWEFAKDPEVDIAKAAGFLPTSILASTVRNVKEMERKNSASGQVNRTPLISRVLADHRANRSLQNLCVLAVMKAVRGDARKVWTLELLPARLMQLFHVPFQELHEELKAAGGDM